MTPGTITRAQLLELLNAFDDSAWHGEAQPTYDLTYEAEEFGKFRAGQPTPPPLVDWWQPWLARVRDLTAEGKTIGRVRVLDEPPTDYQAWQAFALRWHVEAGERIVCVTRSQARAAGMSLDADWWLFDDRLLVTMRFVQPGSPASMALTDDSKIVAQYAAWRDLAIRTADAVKATA